MVIKSLFKLEDIHIVGYSLGGHTAGMVSSFVKTGKLKRITGLIEKINYAYIKKIKLIKMNLIGSALDPAKPLFMSGAFFKRLSPDDAEFVDVIHTDVLARGMLSPLGHADFYVNRGTEQPGCELESKYILC